MAFKLKRTFTYGGRESASFGLYISKEPTYPLGLRKVETYSIPGRNGALHVDTGCYEEFDLELELMLQGDHASAASIASWLNMGRGKPLELHISSWPGIYFMAIPKTTGDMAWILNNFNSIKVKFRCRSEKYLAGIEPTVWRPLSAAGDEILPIHNPTEEASSPLLNIYTSGTAPATFTVRIEGTDPSITDGVPVQSYEFTVTGLTGGRITIDTETGEAYRGNQNLNHLVQFTGRPTAIRFWPGDNDVILVGNHAAVNSVIISPRWWRV
ncbi:MAG: hypothetical protein MJ074_07225 [Oscillospiraceae bacterium]|nr:hypothetical protein [Oscillospiraceae bacterium]